MAFPQPFLDALTERNPIDEVVGQYVSLTRRGSNLFGLLRPARRLFPPSMRRQRDGEADRSAGEGAGER